MGFASNGAEQGFSGDGALAGKSKRMSYDC